MKQRLMRIREKFFLVLFHFFHFLGHLLYCNTYIKIMFFVDFSPIHFYLGKFGILVHVRCKDIMRSGGRPVTRHLGTKTTAGRT